MPKRGTELSQLDPEAIVRYEPGVCVLAPFQHSHFA